jgi:drug/metabolite transporter (DMT)-like permease
MLAVLAGAALIAVSATLVRLSGATPGMAAFFRCAFALPPLWGVMRLDRRRAGRSPLRGRARGLAWLAGVAFGADLVLWSHAINAVGAGLATVLGNLQVVFVALIAWIALGERPAKPLLIALGPMFFGVVLIGGLFGSHTYGNTWVGVGFGAATSICYAAFILLLRGAGGPAVGAVAPLFEATFAGAVTSGGLALVFGDARLATPWPTLGWLALLAVSSQVVGWLLISRHLTALPAALTSALLLVQPAGAVVLGAVIFGENPSVEQLGGVALLLAGVVGATAFGAARPAAATRRRAPDRRPA